MFILGSCSGHDVSITVEPILKRFTVLETVIQVLHFLFCNLLRRFCSLPTEWGSSGSAVVYALRRWLSAIFSLYFFSMHCINGWCRSIVAVNSPMRVDARSYMNVFGTSDSNYHRRQSLWDMGFALPPPTGGLSC